MALSQQQIVYPERDGKPMGETDTHRQEMADLIAALSDYYRNAGDVYVTGNLLCYYEEGNPAAVVVPDVMVVQGVPKGERHTYRLWIEGIAPSVVFEITSRSTSLEDLGNKRALYALLGVREYFLFDPLGEYLSPPLQGFHLEQDEYTRLEPDADGALASLVLGMRLRREGHRLRLTNAASGEPLLTTTEVAEARRVEAQARLVAEQRLAALEAELRCLRGEA